MSALWNTIKSKLVLAGAAVIALLAFLFLVEKSQKDSAEEKLLNAQADSKDKELKDQQTALEQQDKTIVAEGEKEKATPLTQDETVEMLDKL
jgi:hypothetical protein